MTKDMPVSTTRKPRGLHRGPGKRGISEHEKAQWMFMRKAQLMSTSEYTDTEVFRGLPKPKKLFGNEAAEIVWPYAKLLENVYTVHPFTKSIYCYYYQFSNTEQGKMANALARRFAREVMIPITFHNAQCYVETELLLEYGDKPYLVLNGLDGRQEIFSILDGSRDKAALVAAVLKKCDEMGEAVKDPEATWTLFNERPNQNNYLRIDYQWMGDTEEERTQHLVRFDWTADEITPRTHNRRTKLLDVLNSMPDTWSSEQLSSWRRHRYRNPGALHEKSLDTKLHVASSWNARHASSSQRWGAKAPWRPSK